MRGVGLCQVVSGSRRRSTSRKEWFRLSSTPSTRWLTRCTTWSTTCVMDNTPAHKSTHLSWSTHLLTSQPTRRHSSAALHPQRILYRSVVNTDLLTFLRHVSCGCSPLASDWCALADRFLLWGSSRLMAPNLRPTRIHVRTRHIHQMSIDSCRSKLCRLNCTV